MNDTHEVKEQASCRYPDVLALIKTAAGLLDPRPLVINEAHNLNALY
jgi:hypothetical protein